MSYILNFRSRMVHRAASRDKRCQLQRLNPENAMEFSSLEEALDYFSGPDRVRRCPYCLPPSEKDPGGTV